MNFELYTKANKPIARIARQKTSFKGMKKWNERLIKKRKKNPKKPKEPTSPKTELFLSKKILWNKTPYPKGTIIAIM